jgi:hypothetical protein
MKCELRTSPVSLVPVCIADLRIEWYPLLIAGDRQRGVADEYEIDPKQNEGVAYPYHDVKRGRAERKTMHGGDCECCTGVSQYPTLPCGFYADTLIVLRGSRRIA